MTLRPAPMAICRHSPTAEGPTAGRKPNPVLDRELCGRGASEDQPLPPMGSVDRVLRGHARMGRVGAAAPTPSADRVGVAARTPLRSGTMTVDIKTAFIRPMLSGR
jgi:hypothetical protein